MTPSETLEPSVGSETNLNEKKKKEYIFRRNKNFNFRTEEDVTSTASRIVKTLLQYFLAHFLSVVHTNVESVGKKTSRSFALPTWRATATYRCVSGKLYDIEARAFDVRAVHFK